LIGLLINLNLNFECVILKQASILSSISRPGRHHPTWPVVLLLALLEILPLSWSPLTIEVQQKLAGFFTLMDIQKAYGM
jgi:hypothetical protein